MNRFVSYFSSFILLLGLLFSANPVFSQSDDTLDETGETDIEEATSTPSAAENLRQKIDERNIELQKILGEREEIEKKLEETEQQDRSLVRELRTINYRISQLNLSIKANKLVLEKLGLEIDSLGGDIGNIESRIQNKKATVAKLFVKLQQRDRENLLMILLKNKSLSESISEAQSIVMLNNNLTVTAAELTQFRNELIQKLSEEENKKQRREIERSNLVNRQYIVRDQKSEKNRVLRETRNQEKIYEAQIVELDEKQEGISAIIEEIEHELRAAFDPSLLPLKRPGVLGFPVEDPFITQYYGPTKFARRAYRTKTHTGIDFRARIGTPIFAVHDGTVATVDNNDRGTSRWRRYQYGKYIVIEHENNLSSLYSHLSRTVVQKDDTVRRGDLIGYSGNTGYSFGAHLHFGVYWAPSIQYKKISPAAGLVPVGVTIDPIDYLPR